MKRLMNADELEISTTDFDSSTHGHAPSQLVNAGNIFLPLDGLIDIDEELKKLNNQQKQLEGWIKGSRSKLENEKFLSKAPEDVVAAAREHLEELEQKFERVTKLIVALQ